MGVGLETFVGRVHTVVGRDGMAKPASTDVMAWFLLLVLVSGCMTGY